jgi:DNA-binding protein
MSEKDGKKTKTNKNTIFIGNKPVMNYVLATVTEFNGKSSSEVAIKARGKAIHKAIDVTEIVRRRFLKELKIKDIKIGTEHVTNRSGKPQNISTIEIYISAKKTKK